MDQTEGFQCLGHSNCIICSPLSQSCSPHWKICRTGSSGLCSLFSLLFLFLCGILSSHPINANPLSLPCRWKTHRSNGGVPNLVLDRVLEVIKVVILRLPRAVKGHHCGQVRGLRGGQVAQAVNQRIIFARLSSATAIGIKVIEIDRNRIGRSNQISRSDSRSLP